MDDTTMQSLTEVFKCFICMEKLRDARLCPQCSKMCCYLCIRRWLTEQRPSCPHCRASIHLDKLVRCRWADEVTQHIESLNVAGSSGIRPASAAAGTPTCVAANDDHADTTLVDDRCPLHIGEKLTVFCWPCQMSICHHCALWGESHAGHTLKPLDEVYNQRVVRLNEEMALIRRRLVDIVQKAQDVEQNVESVRNAKDECVREMRCCVELMVARIDAAFKEKLVSLMSQKNDLTRQAEMIESLLAQAEAQLGECSRGEMLSRSKDLVSTFEHIVKQAPPSIVRVSAEFNSEIVPGYAKRRFTIERFSELRVKADPIYSQVLNLAGICWRLKIYPDGNGVVRGNYLSIFLELTAGQTSASKYEYRVEMLHQTTLASEEGHNMEPVPNRNVVREFASDFEVGECWGYNRFFKLESLATDGYLDTARDELTVQFQVRPLTYFQKCCDLEWYTTQLEAIQQQQVHQINELKMQFVASNLLNGRTDLADANATSSLLEASQPRPSVIVHQSAMTLSSNSNFLRPPPLSIRGSSLDSDRQIESSNYANSLLPPRAERRLSSLPNLPAEVDSDCALIDVRNSNRPLEERDIDDQNMLTDKDIDQEVAAASNLAMRGYDFRTPDGPTSSDYSQNVDRDHLMVLLRGHHSQSSHRKPRESRRSQQHCIDFPRHGSSPVAQQSHRHHRHSRPASSSAVPMSVAQLLKWSSGTSSNRSPQRPSHRSSQANNTAASTFMFNNRATSDMLDRITHAFRVSSVDGDRSPGGSTARSPSVNATMPASGSDSATTNCNCINCTLYTKEQQKQSSATKRASYARRTSARSHEIPANGSKAPIQSVLQQPVSQHSSLLHPSHAVRSSTFARSRSSSAEEPTAGATTTAGATASRSRIVQPNCHGQPPPIHAVAVDGKGAACSGMSPVVLRSSSVCSEGCSSSDDDGRLLHHELVGFNNDISSSSESGPD